MISGKAAAVTIAEMVAAKDYSSRRHRLYEQRWYAKFGHDFFLAGMFAQSIYYCPFFLDAITNEMRRSGGDMLMARWAEVMTGIRPKTYLFRPDNAAIILVAVVREGMERMMHAIGFQGYKRGYYDAGDENIDMAPSSMDVASTA